MGFESLKKHTVFAAFTFLVFSCADVEDRTNITDPANEEAYEKYLESLEVSSFSSETGSSSSREIKESSSSKKEEPSSSSVQKELESSSAKEDPQSSSSSVDAPASCSSVEPPKSSSSSETKESSSSKKEELSSSSIQEEPESSSAKEDPQSSSSSVEATASSSSEVPPKSSSSVESFTCGTDRVSRGGYDYPTVKIKSTCWLAENLHYETQSSESICYDDKNENCATFGRLYNYEAASVACPSGWKLPSMADLSEMVNYTSETGFLDAAGPLKSTLYWDGEESGTNDLKFNGLPAGFCDGDKECKQMNKVAFWWLDEEKIYNASHYVLNMNADDNSISNMKFRNNTDYLSVRCVKVK